MKLTPEREAYYQQSDENLRSEKSLIAEMEEGGLKVIRRDPWDATGAVLVVPEIVLMRGEARSYYPNAVRDLYDKWIAAGKPSTPSE